MNLFRKALWGVVFLMSVAGGAAAGEPAEAEAVQAAEAFLARLDRGEWTESWESTTTLFRVSTSCKAWEEKMTGVLPLFGAVLERTLRSVTPRSSLAGAPDGRYMIIVFDTVFENKKHAMETVTPALEADGSWRIAGYHLR